MASAHPHRIVSAREKMGRYSAISTNATKPPITIMMAGSMSDRLAAILVLTSSSKNSATLLSMAGSAPVDSPTSIISMASGGKILDCLSEPESGWPSRTLLPAASPARWGGGGPRGSAAGSMGLGSDGRRGEGFGLLERTGERLAFAHALAGGLHGALEEGGAERIGGSFHGLDQRNAADQQGAQNTRQLGHLVLQPDFAHQGHAQFDTVHDLLGRIAPRPPAEQEEGADEPGGKQHDVFLRGGADGDQVDGHEGEFRLHAVVEVGEGGHHVGDQKDHQQGHQDDQHARVHERNHDLLAHRER